MGDALVIRRARRADVARLRALQATSMRALGAGYYTPEEVEAVRARLGATLSGEAFYRRSGYAEIGRETALLPDGTAIAVILMDKDLAG